MSDVTRQGHDLIQAWVNAEEQMSAAYKRAHQAKALRDAARDALANWLLPEDAKEGEKIAVWNGASLIQIEVAKPHPIITVRQRGRGELYPQHGVGAIRLVKS